MTGYQRIHRWFALQEGGGGERNKEKDKRGRNMCVTTKLKSLKKKLKYLTVLWIIVNLSLSLSLSLSLLKAHSVPSLPPVINILEKMVWVKIPSARPSSTTSLFSPPLRRRGGVDASMEGGVGEVRSCGGVLRRVRGCFTGHNPSFLPLVKFPFNSAPYFPPLSLCFLSL